ncbi:MAG: hypothetical protein GF393_10115 [Armatimonadia bacterium]|nr:hypothetical protein [Armatimonadia bacterium]
MTIRGSKARPAAAGIVVVYIALAATWSFVIPLGGGIDEPRHLRYVQIVAEEGRLPTPAEKQEAISHHPPLHYLIVTPAYLAARGMGREAAWHALRLAQIPIGVGTLLLTFAMLRRMLPDRPWLAVVAMASVALLPHFQLVSSVLSNDLTTALFSTLMLYFVVRAIREPSLMLRHALLAGLAGGLAALTRTNAIALIPVAFVAIAVAPLLRSDGKTDQGNERPAPGSRALRGAIAFAGVFCLTGGLWLARHVVIWGGIDPDPPWPEYTWPVHTFLGKFVRAAGGLFRSWWAQVGWIPGPNSAPPPSPTPLWPRPDLELYVFGSAAPLVVIAAVGVVVLLVRWFRSSEHRDRGLALAMLAGCWLLTMGAVVYNAMYVNPGRFEGGRYTLPAVAAVVSLLTIGPVALPRRWTTVVWVFCLGLLTAMTAISFREMHIYLIPTFAK